MTVAELIAELQKMPQDDLVLVHNVDMYHASYNDEASAVIRTIEGVLLE